MKLPSEIGILGVVVWVWYWDNHHEPITRFFWKHPIIATIVWAELFSHMVFKHPRKILLWW